MVDLFEAEELGVYMQRTVAPAVAVLNRALATTRIRNVVGRARWARLTAEQAEDLKPVALDVAKRLTLNPGGLRQVSIDDYAATFATETVTDTGLTQSEIDAVEAVFTEPGQSPAAFSIAPAAPAPYRPAPPDHRWWR